jgi:predicted RNA methylase
MTAAQLNFDFTNTNDLPILTQSSIATPYPISKEKQSEKVELTTEFNFAPYGSWVNYGKRLTASERLRLNCEAINLLSKERLSCEELNILRSYSGWGGLSTSDERGVLYDYYTSPPIAALSWQILNSIQPIMKNSKILEPSCGTGVFFITAPDNVFCTGVELDGRTASIATRLHPNVEVIHKSYEAFNVSGNHTNCYDHIIGNVPFGERTIETSFLDMPEEKSLDRYFISRSLDNLKHCGTTAVIAHSGVLANTSNKLWRSAINKKAQFMGAIKLNDSSFNHTHTSIQPDILLFKKHPEDICRRLQTFPLNNGTDNPLEQEYWIKGTYFSERPNHVMDSIRTGNGQWGSDTVSGSVTSETLQAVFEAFKPETIFSEQDYDVIRKKIPLPEQIVKTSILTLTEYEIKAAEQKRLFIGSVKTADTAVYVLSNTYQWNLISDDSALVQRIEHILKISNDVKRIRELMRKNQNVESIQKETSIKINAYKDLYGEYPKDDRLICRFLRSHPAVSGIYEALIDLTSNILTVNNLYSNNGAAVNGHNRAVEALRFLQQRMLNGSPETIKHHFPDEAEELIIEMHRNPVIFLSEQYIWQLREDFLSGGAWEKIDALNELFKTESDDDNIIKLQYGINELEKAVGWIPIEEADFSPHSSWIPEETVNAWISDKDGLDRKELIQDGKLARNESGKWDIRYDRGHSIYDAKERNYITLLGGQWYELADEVIYYLNMQKQRSKYNDTEIFNREQNDNFKNYIANHKTYCDELEIKYNRIFNTEIGVPVKTYPVYLEGWQTDVKNLKPHQWQSTHHLYREGKGISALGGRLW